MAKIFTPTNQVRLTNVSIVRLKKGGFRFEIACYPNKVNDWRSKVEGNLDEVLQSRAVFTNVSKGEVAKKDVLSKVFNTDDLDKIIAEILKKGELQVSGKERQQLYGNLAKDIATIVAEKCVDPETKRPLTVGLVERALKDIHFVVKPNKSAKSQALEAIKAIQAGGVLKIERACLHLRIILPVAQSHAILESISDRLTISRQFEEEEEGSLILECTIDPGSFRGIEETIRQKTKGQGKVEIQTVTNEEQKIE